MTRRPPSLLFAAAVCCALGACGLPPAGSSATIPAEQLPYGLEQTAPPPTTQAPLPTLAAGPTVWLVRGDRLAPTAAPRAASDSSDPRVVADTLIARLANGPTESELASRFRSALGPTVTLKLVEVSNGTAVVDLNPGESGQGGAAQLPLAAGQIVLTLTSITGVDSVQIVHRDEPLSVPLPSGILTTRTLTASDYLDLVEHAPTQAAPEQTATTG